MSRFALALATFLLAAPAPSQPIAWDGAPRVQVILASFKYKPHTLHLRAGKPVVLRFVNASSGGHDFTAREFFAAATLAAPVPGGKVDLEGHGTREVALVPKAGRYKVRCTHIFHQTLGMTGEIVVD